MAIETEFRYLIEVDDINQITQYADSFSELVQGYLTDTPERVVRIRTITDFGLMMQPVDSAFVTIKGSKVGASAPEFESEVDYNEFAKPLMESGLVTNKIVKTRYYMKLQSEFAPLIIELDVFHEALQGLVIAEIEIPQSFIPIMAKIRESFPEWLKNASDITEDFHYSNMYLGKNGIPNS